MNPLEHFPEAAIWDVEKLIKDIDTLRHEEKKNYRI